MPSSTTGGLPGASRSAPPRPIASSAGVFAPASPSGGPGHANVAASGLPNVHGVGLPVAVEVGDDGARDERLADLRGLEQRHRPRRVVARALEDRDGLERAEVEEVLDSVAVEVALEEARGAERVRARLRARVRA